MCFSPPCSQGLLLSCSSACSPLPNRKKSCGHSSHVCTYPLKGQCEDNKTKPCQLGEQVFQDGNHLTRVMSLSQLKPGTFFGDYKANAVYLGDDPTGHVIEMAKTQTAIDKSADNVTVTGLTIQQFASRPQAGAPGTDDHGVVRVEDRHRFRRSPATDSDRT